jgi:DNA-directed RNA polymerase sigma subunit (sigma70/sigma32)
MEGKKKAGAAAVTEAAAQAVLRRGPAPDLAPDEEKVMRMRLGASPPARKALERVGQGFSDTEIELLSYEIEAHLKLRGRVGQGTSRRAPPAPSRVKEKIVRALRKKN